MYPVYSYTLAAYTCLALRPGFRDASLVTTPPPERRPINTVLQCYDAFTVRKAVQYELDRGGQIFYVAGGFLSTSTRPTSNHLLLLCV
jgi:hypothetical protein